MYTSVTPRPETCSTCGQPFVRPKIVKVNHGATVVTEAHWICPRCSNRFKIGSVDTTPSEKK